MGRVSICKEMSRGERYDPAPDVDSRWALMLGWKCKARPDEVITTKLPVVVSGCLRH